MDSLELRRSHSDLVLVNKYCLVNITANDYFSLDQLVTVHAVTAINFFKIIVELIYANNFH